MSLTFSSLRTYVSNPLKILHGDDISHDYSLLYSQDVFALVNDEKLCILFIGNILSLHTLHHAT